MTPLRSLDEWRDVLRNLPRDPATGCWVWQGSRDNGYGQASARVISRTRLMHVHRIAYRVFFGDLPAGPDYHVHHTCGNRACCNPEHLELISAAEHGVKSWNRGGRGGAVGGDVATRRPGVHLAADPLRSNIR